MTGTVLEQTLRSSKGPLFLETGCSSFRSSSTISLLPAAIQFSAFVSPQHTSLLLPSLFSRTSPRLGTDVHWPVKDIGQSPQRPVCWRVGLYPPLFEKIRHVRQF